MEKKMENEMETEVIKGLYWGVEFHLGIGYNIGGYNGIMEKKMETTI